MRVGIYWGEDFPDVTIGGGFTVASSLIEAVLRVRSHHKFLLIHHGPLPPWVSPLEGGSVRAVQIDAEVARSSRVHRALRRIRALGGWEREPERDESLHRTILLHRVEFVWFLTPDYRYVEAPYLFPVWDLQHRRQPFFPEVSISGYRFEAREAKYGEAIRRAAFVIAGNETARAEVERFYAPDAERVLTLELPTPGYVLSESPEATPHVMMGSRERPYLFYPAQFWPHKNHIRLLEAIRVLRDDHGREFDVVFTGSDMGNLAYVRACANEWGLSDQVLFLGFVRREELVALYREAFALVLPSFFGPNNLPPLEAGALGCPSVVADVPGMREQLGDAALYFHPTRATEIAARVLELEADASHRAALIAAGRRRALAWTPDDYVARVVEVLDGFEPIRRCWSSDSPYRHP